jgi:hypothetical protein
MVHEQPYSVNPLHHAWLNAASGTGVQKREAWICIPLVAYPLSKNICLTEIQRIVRRIEIIPLYQAIRKIAKGFCKAVRNIL